MVYNVNYFIKKFEAIPEDMWTTGDFESGPCKCALGHCGMGGPFSTSYTPESAAIQALLRFNTAEINDGEKERYQQPTPKQRILAALNDVKNETF